MLKVPCNGLLYAFRKHGFRFPADFRLDLIRRNGISAVMALAVLHIGNQISGNQRPSRIVLSQHFLEGIYDNLNDLYILLFIMSADIVCFKKPALLLYHIDGLCMILHVQPVAHILAVSVYGQLSSMKRIVDNQRNELLRELIRAIVVGAVSDVRREMIGIHIGFNKHVRAGLACGIGAVRRIWCCLIKILTLIFQGSVYLIGGYMKEFLSFLEGAIRILPCSLGTV